MDFYVALHSLFFISLLCCVFRQIAGEGEVTTDPFVAVTVGETATLPCSFDHSQVVALDWMKGPDVNSAQLIIRMFKTRVIPGTDDRYNMTSDFSLVLSESRQEDSDIYWCRVTLQGIFESLTNLTILPVRPTTTSEKTTTGKPAGPTKPAPEKLISNSTTIYIIIACIGSLIILALSVLVVYCCCCKRKTPKGYDKPKPV